MTQAMGRGGVTLATVAAVVMSAAVFLTGTPHPQGMAGLCLPSPNAWNLIPLASWTGNILLILLCALTLALLNKAFSIITGPSGILPGLFAIMAVSIPWVGGTLTSSAIVALAMLICLAILFGSYRSPNATRELFLTATILSLGSMIQYAFLLMTVPVLVIALMFKCLRLKETIAFIMGLCAPYWIALGLGLVGFDHFTLPRPHALWDNAISAEMLLTGMINLAFTALASLFLAFYNGLRLYAGNTRRRMFNMAVNVLQGCALACMVCDYANMTAYMTTFYACASFQFANIFALRAIRRPRIWGLALSALYIAFFIVAII